MCFDDYDDVDLKHGQRAAWEGIWRYWTTNGTKHDYKGNPDYWNVCCHNWQEYADSPAGEYFNKELVYEPCNYASNVAYYHSVVKMCDYPDWHADKNTVRDLKRSFSALAVGSSFMHSSHTNVGNRFDG